MYVGDQRVAQMLSSHPSVVQTWLFYQSGEKIIEHGPNPYVARYYICGNTREELDEITRYFFEHMSIRDGQDREVLYQNKIGD